jgi:hypothetical protein
MLMQSHYLATGESLHDACLNPIYCFFGQPPPQSMSESIKRYTMCRLLIHSDMILVVVLQLTKGRACVDLFRNKVTLAPSLNGHTCR